MLRAITINLIAFLFALLVVKANEVYESVRLLGRGAFGDVYLVKTVDDHKLYAHYYTHILYVNCP